MKKHRFACCLSSYSRFDNMQLQIYQMLNQTYDNFHLFVACKGISEYTFNTFIKPQFQKYIDEGKLTLRHFPNKNQLSNFFDTIRDLDVSEFDFFCKIDDDDWYFPNYLEEYNKIANDYPNGFHFRQTHDRMVRLNNKGHCSFEPTGSYICSGPTICMTRSHLEGLRKAEESEENLKAYVEAKGLPKALLKCGFIEDKLFLSGLDGDEYNHIFKYPEQLCLVNLSNSSVTRQGFLFNDFREKNEVFTKNPDYFEHVLTVDHFWHGRKKELRIFNKKANYYFANWIGDVEEFAPNRIVIRWSGKTEELNKKENGLWICEKAS